MQFSSPRAQLPQWCQWQRWLLESSSSPSAWRRRRRWHQGQWRWQWWGGQTCWSREEACLHKTQPTSVHLLVDGSLAWVEQCSPSQSRRRSWSPARCRWPPPRWSSRRPGFSTSSGSGSQGWQRAAGQFMDHLVGKKITSLNLSAKRSWSIFK